MAKKKGLKMSVVTSEGSFEIDTEKLEKAAKDTKTIEYGGVSGERLRSLVERIERLEFEKKNITEDITSVYSEAKSTGYDKSVIKHIIKLRKATLEQRQEFDHILDTYMHALGMLPLFDEDAK